MPWLFWVVLPLPLMMLVTLVYSLTRRDADPKQRMRMALVSGIAMVLGVVLAVLAAMR